MKKKSPYDFYTLKQIVELTNKTNNWGKSAVDCLTKAFKEKKRLAIKDKGIRAEKIPKVWYSLCDYIEIDGKVVKPENGKRV